MAVKLNVQANVTGQGQITKLNAGLKTLGTQALIAKRKLAALQAGAARARATMVGLGTALKVGVVAGFAAGGIAAVSFVKGTIEAGNIVEKSRIQFNAFFGDVKKGGEAFDVLNEFAAKVPFTLDEIIRGGTALAAISKGPADLGKQLKLVGNLAATANISFQDAALQYQKVASAGVGAADLLRDRGVTGLLGFTAGAKVSVAESVRVFEEAFLNGGKFSKVSNDLADTLTGNVSMVQDFFFRIKAAAAEPLFKGLSAQVKELMADLKTNDKDLKALGVRVGESLARGFKRLGDFIKFVITNFESLIMIVKIFIGLKIVSFVGSFVQALLLLVVNLKAAGGAAVGLNVALRANPIGLIVTAIQGLTLVAFYFKEELLELVDTIKNYFIRELKIAAKWVTWLGSKLKIFPTFAKNAGDASNKLSEDLKQMGRDADTVAASYVNLTQKQKDAFAGNLEDPTVTKRKNYQGPNPRGDMRKAEIAAAEKAAKINEFIRIQAFKNKINFDTIVREAEAAAQAKALESNEILADSHVKLHQDRLDQVKEYRAKLSLIGIDSQAIGGIIGDTWLEGIKAGNSLLDTTKNAFKNVLVSISDAIVKRTAQVLVEKLFNTLIDQRIMKQKALNSATSEQGNIMQGLISKAGSLFSAMGSGGGSKLGSLFSMGRSFLGFNKGGVVPGGAPYTDRVPAMLTPGEVVVPRSKVDSQSGSTNITNINISGNVDQRSIDQIKSVISSASAEVGGANKAYTKNTQGVRGRNI